MVNKNIVEPKLTIELIPSSVFGSNVRTNVPKKDWDRIRKECYIKADYKCEICGDNGLNQGYKHKLEAHEKWHYDYETKTQILVKVIGLCVNCHLIKHIGRTFAIGKQATAFKHIEKVNNWNHKQVIDYIVQCFIEHKEKSKINWKLDLTHLKLEYNIGKLEISKGESKRSSAKKPFWFKKKK